MSYLGAYEKVVQQESDCYDVVYCLPVLWRNKPRAEIDDIGRFRVRHAESPENVARIQDSQPH